MVVDVKRLRVLYGKIFGVVQGCSEPSNQGKFLNFQPQTAEMDTSKVLSLLETLDDEIDDLEEAIAPLVMAPLSETASKLPLLDKAKLYVLVTYAIESLLFCECDVSFMPHAI